MTIRYSKEETAEKLREILGEEQVLRDVPMSKYTSFRAGGNADHTVKLNSLRKEHIQNAGGKHAPHRAAFQYKSVFHLFSLCFLNGISTVLYPNVLRNACRF